jgi:formate hydrogenlyase subunit 4
MTHTEEKHRGVTVVEAPERRPLPQPVGQLVTLHDGGCVGPNGHERDRRVTAPNGTLSPAGALAFAALIVVIVAETGRLPVDNPSTHLELTMVHEAMVLEYSGAKLAVIEWGAAMRLVVLLGLLANLFFPLGVADAASGPIGTVVAVGVIAAKVGVLGVGLAAAEVFVAKIRLFRVPELLAGSFLLGLLAVTASYFLAPRLT